MGVRAVRVRRLLAAVAAGDIWAQTSRAGIASLARADRHPQPARLAVALCAGLALAAVPSNAGAQVSFSSPTSFAAGDGPFAVAVGDFNGDSDPDLAVANVVSNNVSVLAGGAGGSFTTAMASPQTGKEPRAIAVGDFNGDADPDLAVANHASDDVSVLIGGPGATFSAAATTLAVGDGPRSVAVGDFNGDSDPDLAVANNGSDNVSVLLGAAGASFSPATSLDARDGPFSIAVGDFNADTHRDIAVANDLADNVSVLLGAGNGSFSPRTNFRAGPRPESLAVGDFNGDSDPDLAVANFSNPGTASVLLGGAGGSFSGATSFPARDGPGSLAVGDFNRDTDPDLAIANFPTSGTISVLLGGAGASFSAPTSFAAGDAPRSVAVGDFDGDSDPDLAVASVASDTVSILMSTPHTTIDSGPSGETTDEAATFSFSSNEPGSRFECRIDDDAFQACTSAHTTARLAHGLHRFEVRAIDPAGNTDPTPAARSFTITRPSPPGVSPPGVSPPGPSAPSSVTDRRAPRVSGYGLTNTRFAVGSASTPTSGRAAATKAKQGATLRYTLSEAATARIVIAQRAAGRLRGTRCMAPTRSLRKAKKCTRTLAAATLTRTSRQGANRVSFSGRIASRALKPGRYQATLTATDKAKNASKPKTITFTIVKR